MKFSKQRVIQIIQEESLKLLKENQAFDNLYDNIEELEDTLISTYESKLQSLKKQEDSIREKEDFSELNNIKAKQSKVVGRLIKSYEKKIDYLRQLKEKIEEESGAIKTEGDKVFNNRSINEVTQETLQTGEMVKLTSPGTETKMKKYSDGNHYQVVSTNIKGLQEGDILSPKNDIRKGSSCTMGVSRDVGGSPTHLKNMQFKTISDLIKNPS